jgi:hypothetical protein
MEEHKMDQSHWRLIRIAGIVIAVCLAGTATAWGGDRGASGLPGGPGNPLALLQLQVNSLQQQVVLLAQQIANLGGGTGGGTSIQVQYVVGGMFPNTSVARAFCPTGTKITGGGGFSLNGAGLQQSFPISDETGTIAIGIVAIGWQVAASDFSDVQAFVACAGP